MRLDLAWRSIETNQFGLGEFAAWCREAGVEPMENFIQDVENHYSVTDAVAVGSMLIALLRQSDRVRVACQAQLVNVIAPIFPQTGGAARRQIILHPFAQAARYGRGDVLRVEPVSPVVETKGYGEAPLLHATAVRGQEGVTVFARRGGCRRRRRHPHRGPSPAVVERDPARLSPVAERDRHVFAAAIMSRGACLR